MHNAPTPIDIHCSKLVDWLVQRRHCKKDWGENLAIIRRKIRAALGDMPENEELKQLLIGSKLDYFKSKKILELLKTTEADSKNIFGFYSSQRMKDWQDIVHSYEKDCVYLAEVATDLIRETNYEVPAIRKVINKLVKEREELEKEKSNLLRRAQHFKSEYNRLAISYGIKGDDIEEELRLQSRSLEDVMTKVLRHSKELCSVFHAYMEHLEQVTKINTSTLLTTLRKAIDESVGEKPNNNLKHILTTLTTRDEYLNGLYELEAFLVQLSVTANENASLGSISWDENPQGYQLDKEESLNHIRQIMILLNNDKNKLLFRLNEFPDIIDEVKEKFDNISQQSLDYNYRAESLDERFEDLEKQKKETEVHLRKSIISAKELQNQVENSLRDLYRGRTINIMGCIN